MSKLDEMAEEFASTTNEDNHFEYYRAGFRKAIWLLRKDESASPCCPHEYARWLQSFDEEEKTGIFNWWFEE